MLYLISSSDHFSLAFCISVTKPPGTSIIPNTKTVKTPKNTTIEQTTSVQRKHFLPTIIKTASF
jgi:hypothetical protein